MAWVKVDIAAPRDPRLLAVGHRAAWVFVCSLCYCGEHLTDGFVPTAALPLCNGTKADARRLEEQELWQPVDGGWKIRGYLDRQRSREQVERDRAEAAERQARWKEKKKRTNGVKKPVTPAVTTPAVTPLLTPLVTPAVTTVDKEVDPSPSGREGSTSGTPDERASPDAVAAALADARTALRPAP